LLSCAIWQFISCFVIVDAVLAVAMAGAIFFWARAVRRRHITRLSKYR